jgi:hypothetical protein
METEHASSSQKLRTNMHMACDEMHAHPIMLQEVAHGHEVTQHWVGSKDRNWQMEEHVRC